MDEPHFSRPDSKASKRMKVVHKSVVTVKIEPKDGKEKKSNELTAPCDCWSWRKYGQKPIKGSPFPRGYYRCSTSKECSAKKQVERCRTDASMLIITYTSTHNHPSPSPSPSLVIKPPKHDQQPTAHEKHLPTSTTKQDDQQIPKMTNDIEDKSDHHFHYSHESPFNNSSLDILINQEETPIDKWPYVLFDEEEPLITYPHHDLMTFPTVKPKSEENNDFYDELEELPISSNSSFSSFMRANLSGFGENNSCSPFLIN